MGRGEMESPYGSKEGETERAKQTAKRPTAWRGREATEDGPAVALPPKGEAIAGWKSIEAATSSLRKTRGEGGKWKARTVRRREKRREQSRQQSGRQRGEGGAGPSAPVHDASFPSSLLPP